MSSQAYNPQMASSMPRPAAYGAPVPASTPAAPAGTFAPGTKIQVGSHKVVIQKYFSEGGFAHVYLVKMPKAIDGTDIAVLKRVAVPDKDALANMRTEVETMKKLKGHRPIVTYYDSHASQLKGGGYEVFLLMEFCNGGGLIDFMNTRLQNRLTEPEILKIFSDVTEGVACMHYLKPPLLHRDLKVENVLITTSGNSRRFKVCDFGSTAPPRPAATNVAECRLIEEDIQKHTTLQYRSPEMIDVYRKQAIDEKSDIWALGVLLYKLCYYTTPFEEQGQLAILNASYKFPSYPPFSDNLKKLIASMLREQPQSRPNVYQVLREACMMQGIECPIKDIYAGRTQSESRRNQQLPALPDAKSPPTVGAVYAPPQPTKQYIPEVVPMRRGRPTAAPTTTAKPAPSPMRGASSDPFAALDAKSPPALVTDDISSRFPSLDQFSLLHEKGSKFEFDASSPTSTTSQPKPISQRVTEKLADDAFAAAQSKTSGAPTVQPKSSSSISRAQMIISSNPELQKVASAPTPIRQSSPDRPKMVSQGTMTSPDTTPIERPANSYLPSNPTSDYKSPPIYRFPPVDHHRSSSVPRNQDPAPSAASNLSVESQRPHIISRNTSYQPRPVSHIRQASSSRPSLEGGRPILDNTEPVTRTKSSISNRPRPASVYLESDLDYLREREASRKDSKATTSAAELAMSTGSDSGPDEPIHSNVEFLRSMEEADNVSKHRRNASTSSSKTSKRASMPSMSLSGTKTLLAGKFGDAFKRFESNTSGASGSSSDARPRTPSPLQALDRRDLTPIAGSEATDGRSDDGHVEEPAMTAAQKRDLERQRLEQEEQRVAAAAAEYRRRVADREVGGVAGNATGGSGAGYGGGKAAAIQSKVRSLLDENSKPAAPKTAEGYGRFTDSSPHNQVRKFQSNAELRNAPATGRKPDLGGSSTPGQGGSGGAAEGQQLNYTKVRAANTGLAVGQTSPSRNRPSAPPKPVHLGSTTTGPGAGAAAASATLGGAVGGADRDRVQMPRRDMTPAEKEDYIADFSKRFPSLSGIEMVEARIGGKEV